MAMEYVELIQIMTLITDDVPDVYFKLRQFDIATGTRYMVMYLTIGYYFPIPIRQETGNSLFLLSSNWSTSLPCYFRAI